MTRTRPKRGEVWLVDLGLAAKTRPCLLLTGYPDDDELALITVVSHTTALRGNKWELPTQQLAYALVEEPFFPCSRLDYVTMA